MQPNELASKIGSFVKTATWTPRSGGGIEMIFANSKYFLPSGFHPEDNIFASPFHNLEGKVVNVVLSNVTTFAYTFSYPNKSKIRSGPDFLAAHYLSEALNFRLRCMAKYYD